MSTKRSAAARNAGRKRRQRERLSHALVEGFRAYFNSPLRTTRSSTIIKMWTVPENVRPAFSGQRFIAFSLSPEPDGKTWRLNGPAGCAVGLREQMFELARTLELCAKHLGAEPWEAPASV